MENKQIKNNVKYSHGTAGMYSNKSDIVHINKNVEIKEIIKSEVR